MKIINEEKQNILKSIEEIRKRKVALDDRLKVFPNDEMLQSELDNLITQLEWAQDTLDISEMHERCDQCGKYTSTRTGAKFFHGKPASKWEPDEPSEFYCPKCAPKD